MAVIVVVDDDPDVLEVCRLLLEKEGHVVLSAKDSEDGKTLIKRAQPDLIILDVMMDRPDDGIVMAREARLSGVDVPILILTAINEVSEMLFGSDNEIIPIDEFISKPVQSETLIAIVQKHLKKEDK